MTGFKNTAVLAIVLAVLAGLYALLERPLQSRQKKEPAALVPDFEKHRSQAVRVTITRPSKGQVVLTKTAENAWTVSAQDKTFAADTTAVGNVLDTVAKLRADTVASRNQQNFEGFEVTEGKGSEVKIEDAENRTLAHFYVGKNGPDIFSTYLRLKDSPTVVLTNTLVKTVFERELKDWRDKAIVKLSKDDIAEYAVAGDQSLVLRRDDKGLWQVTKPETFPAKKDAAEKAISGFAGLKAVDFPEGKLSEFGLDKPIRTITAALKDGRRESVLVGKDKNAYQYFVKTGGSDTVYVIEKYSLDALCPSLETLKEPAPQEKKADNATR